MNTQAVKLPNRAQISISGEDTISFLQELITQDVKTLDLDELRYGCLLTPQGKFLHDFFIRQEDGAILLDCEGGERAEDLLKRLKLYKLRSKVALELTDNIDVFQLWGKGQISEDSYADPRHKELGYRFYKKPEDTEIIDFNYFDYHRVGLCVPDGSRDLIVEKSTLLESHIDKLNGIDFKKGCYVGQELTARMHYRGLAKKHLYALESDTDIKDDGTLSDIRSICGNRCIALLKDAEINQLPNSYRILNKKEV